MRAVAITVLAIVALAGATVAGLEKVFAPVPAQQAVAVQAPPVAPARVLPPPPPPIPCPPPARVCVQLGTSSAWLLTAGVPPVGPVPIRHGRPDSPTPLGVFTVESQRADHVNSNTGAPMPWSVFFGDGLALFEADLSEPSAGSIRMPAPSAEDFYSALGPGDVVHVVP